MVNYVATLGSILDSQLAETLASFSLQDGATKWQYNHASPATPHPTTSISFLRNCAVSTPSKNIWIYFHVRCPHPSLNIWICFYVRCPHPRMWNVRCPPPLLLKHLWILCGVPTLTWLADQICSLGMCGVPPPCIVNIWVFCAVSSPPTFQTS